jgi:hypothetical protein
MTADSGRHAVHLAEYAAAIAGERSAWQLWKNAGSNEAERALAYARWKYSIEHARAAAIRLQSADTDQGKD